MMWEYEEEWRGDTVTVGGLVCFWSLVLIDNVVLGSKNF